jgi:hypothetical protein
MRESLRALLTGVIDYAGLFPPARLPLDEAIRNYARYRTGPDSWMLGRFVVPAARLGELAGHAELFAQGPPFAFAALGRGGNTAAEFLTALRDDLGDIADFRQDHGRRVTVEVLEVRLPADVLGRENYPAALHLLADAGRLIEELGPPKLTPFIEAPLRADWRTEVEAVLEALAVDAHTPEAAHRTRYRRAGFKLRCGGLEPSAFPTTEQVAFVLVAAEERRVPLKFTAGLHHPFRRFDPDVQAHTHGFLNVFVAGLLGASRGLDEEAVRQLLEFEASPFRFDDADLVWGEEMVTLEEIKEARHRAVTSFGSCSFDEPRDDLRALGLL